MRASQDLFALGAGKLPGAQARVAVTYGSPVPDPSGVPHSGGFPAYGLRQHTATGIGMATGEAPAACMWTDWKPPWTPREQNAPWLPPSRPTNRTTARTV